MRLAARSTVIAGALVIAAITASAATAQFNLGPRQRLYVNPSTGYPTPALSQSQASTSGLKFTQVPTGRSSRRASRHRRPPGLPGTRR